MYGAQRIETNVPGKRDRRKKVAIRKVVSGEIEVCCEDIEDLRLSRCRKRG